MKNFQTETHGAFSLRTLVRWLTVLVLSVSGLLTTITGVYFLFAPAGGYQGGRNPHYGETFLFSRQTWTDIHTWAGIVMVAVAVFHLALHWRWVAEMTKRSLAVVIGRRKPFNRKIWLRVGVVAAITLFFLGAAASGIYFFVVPGGTGSGSSIQFLFSRSTWNLIHTWAGVLMIVAAIVHVVTRWKWIARVTPNVVRTMVSPKERLPEGAPTWPSA